MTLKEYIKQITREVLDEESSSGDAGGYLSPMAFSKKGQGKNAATKYAEKEGWKVTKGETQMPGDSKIKDYVSLTGKKKKKVKIYKESDYDKASPSSNPSLYNKASGYTGVGRDNHVSTYYKENINENTATNLIKQAEKDGYIKGDYSQRVLDAAKKIAKEYNNLKNNEERKTLRDTYYNKFLKLLGLNESLINIIKEELLNEVTYHKFKNEVKFRTKNEQLHKAIREVKRKLAEIDRIVEYTSRMKQELSEGEEGLKYWKKTESNVATISEMINQLNNKIKNLQQ